MSTTLVELIATGIFLVCILDGVHKGLLLKVFSLLRMVVVLALTMILVPVLKPLFAANSEVQMRATPRRLKCLQPTIVKILNLL